MPRRQNILTGLMTAAALLALAGCTHSSYMGQEKPEERNAIAFSSSAAVPVKAVEGASAAELLGRKFIVHAIKTNSDEPSIAFDKTPVLWKEGSKGPSWEYIDAETSQPARYWDGAAQSYDFVALSQGKGNIAIPGSIDLSKVGSEEAVYTLAGTLEQIAASYVSPWAHVNPEKYHKVVGFSFRSPASKVRIAMYESIPGYSVQDVKFASNATDTPESTTATLFTSSECILSGTISAGVSYPDESGEPAFAFSGTESANSLAMSALTLKARENKEAEGTNYIGRSTNDASFSGFANTVAMTPAAEDLHISVNYTLVPTDGSTDRIIISKTMVTIPAVYADWKPNHSYTYFFKITASELTPIVFDSQTVTGPDGLTYELTIGSGENCHDGLELEDLTEKPL